VEKEILMRNAIQLHWQSEFWLIALTIAVAALSPGATSAVERVYTLVPQESSIAISGSVMTDVGTSPIQPQGPGGLATTYSGTIRTDRTNNTIQFLPGSSIDASVSGEWQPLPTGATGSAAADYGGRVSFLFGLVTINFAARDFLGDLSSGVLPVNGNGEFSLTTTDVTFLNGNLAFRVSTGDAGSESIVGESGPMSGTGSLTSQTDAGGTLETLSIPIDSSFRIPVGESTTVNLELTGELVATATLPNNLPGDFNGDGIVDAADYVAWRKGLGTTYTQADYDLWRANFGSTAGNGAALFPAWSQPAAVPEPSSLVQLIGASAVLLLCCGLSCRLLGRINRPMARDHGTEFA
jgi:hypothetical protein